MWSNGGRPQQTRLSIVGEEKKDGTEARGRGFDGPLTPEEAKLVIETNKKGVAFLPSEVHAQVQIMRGEFPARLRRELRKGYIPPSSVYRAMVTEIAQTWEDVKTSALLGHLPYDVNQTISRAATPCYLQFYAAWCVMLVRAGETPLPHYVAKLNRYWNSLGRKEDWVMILAQLPPQEQASQAA